MLFEVPQLSVPFTARTHPQADRIRERTRTWAREKGLLDNGIWTPESLDAADFGFFTAATHPDAAPDRVELLADWVTWSWFHDDAVEVFKKSRNVMGLKAFVARLKELTGDAPPVPVGPVEEALADLWARSLEAMPEDVLRALSAALDVYVDATLWEIHNDAQGRVPDPVDYVEMRRLTNSTDLSAVLATWAVTGEALAPELRGLRETKTLTDTFGDVVGLHNDLVSFEKDVVREGTVANNAVLATRNFFGGTPQDAANVVADLVAARVREFQTVAAEAPSELTPFVRILESWLAGYYAWAGRTGRYDASEPLRFTLHRLTYNKIGRMPSDRR